MRIGRRCLIMTTLLAAGSLLLWGGCAKKTYINVDYRLPDTTHALAGRTVYVQTRDLREETNLFNPRAEEKFRDFNGLFSLAMVTPGEQYKMLGTYTLPKLFEAAIKERLQAMGVALTDDPSAGLPIFRIDLNRFRIDRIGQKWVADVSYQASLTRDDRLVAREAVSGSAERIQVVGSGGAEKVLSDIFTEMINRLDIERLFQQANV